MGIEPLKYQYLQLNKIREVRRPEIKRDEKLFEACEDFEALFVKQMLDSMRQTVPKTGILNGGIAEDIFEEMLYSEYAKLFSRNTRLGIAEAVYREVSSGVFSNKKKS
ncbi:MAG: hypothetical protein DRP87_16195 [Spirochaetes bacterium]|nr:MAG: hypothetical protein DRP87_16195 [Spirochaetota bacterium]